MRIKSNRYDVLFIILLLIIFILLSYIIHLSLLYPYDKILLDMINGSSGSEALNAIMLTLTDFGGGFFWLLFMIVLWVYGEDKERRFAIFLAITIIASGTLGLTLKAFLYRPRPYFLEGINLIGLEEYGSSFPSGHSIRAFAGSTLMFRGYERIASPLLALSLVVAFSRVYLGVHYPTDTIAGALLGLAIANFIFIFTKKSSSIIDRISNVWMNFSKNPWRKMIFPALFSIILFIISINFILFKEPKLLNDPQYIISNLPIILDPRNFFDYGLIFLWPLSALSVFIYPLSSLFLLLISALLMLSAKKVKDINLSNFTLKTGVLLFALSLIIIASALFILIYLFIGLT